MPFNLTAITRAKGVRRRSITLRPIIPTQAQAADLAAILAPAWQVWHEAADRILAGYDPTPLADALTTDSPSQVEQTIEQTAAEFLRLLVTNVTPSLRRFSTRIETWHRSKWVNAVNAGTGVDLSTVLTAQPVQESLDAWLARNVALVRNISDQAQARISDAVFRGYQQRTPQSELTKEIREATGFAHDRSRRIASDQSSKLAAALDDERMAEAGLELWKYRHSGKLHPRSWHLHRDGRIYTLRGNKQVNSDGSPMDGGDAIEAGDAPSEPPFCACKKQGYLALFAEIE